MINPFLKWAGGKRKLAPAILNKLGKGKRLVEPFVGGGAVWLAADYDEYLLCDSNADLINLYDRLKTDGEDFINYCQTFFGICNNPEHYYMYRDIFNHGPAAKVVKAALFLYLNRHSYNGLIRYNAKSEFNAPFGRYKNVYFPRQEMLDFHKKAQRATFICQDFRETFKQLQAGDVVYCDPPYVPLSTTANFTGYTGNGFTAVDQFALACWASDCGHLTVVSNHDTEFTRHQLYFDADEIIPLDVRRNISCQDRGKVKEVMAVWYGS